MEYLFKSYNHIMYDLADVRTQSWPLATSIWPTVAIVALYLVIVYWLPILMRDRKAVDLTNFMFAYNVVLVVWSTYMFLQILTATVFNEQFTLSCAAVDYSDDPKAVQLAWALYLYYVSKLVELLDTVIFILRKKDNQVTFLHVYHHGTMPFWWWCAVKWVTGGESYFTPLLNSFVHICMYSYYALAGLGPAIQPYLWWKKYITLLQISQFYVVISKTIFTIVFGQCSFSKAYLLAQLFYVASMVLLFSNFYQTAYKKEVPIKCNGKSHSVTNSVTNGQIKSSEELSTDLRQRL